MALMVGDSFAVEDGGERAGGAGEVRRPGERAVLVVGAEVRLHGEEAVEAVGGQRAHGLADLPVALARGDDVAGGQQRVLDLDVDGVRAQLRVAVGERGDAHLHVVGGVPGQPQGGRPDRLDDVEDPLRDVAVDVLLVLVQQHDAGGLGQRREGAHPAEHLVAVPLGRLVRAQEEREDPDERGAEALGDGQGPVGPDEVGVEVVLDIDLAERRADRRDRQAVARPGSPPPRRAARRSGRGRWCPRRCGTRRG